MFSLESILREYATPVTSIEAGGDELRKPKRPATRKSLDKKRFREQLAAVRRTNTWCMVALVVMIVLVLAGTMFLVQRNLNDATVVLSLFAGFATISGGLTAVILAIVKVLQRSRVLYLLAESLDAASLQTIVDVLADG
jgi:hypothetical protein